MITHRSKVTIKRGTKLSRVQRGDLVFGFADGGTLASMIHAFQKERGYPELGCRATHVALCLGGDQIVHAISPRVCQDELVNYFEGREVAFATWRLPASHSGTREDAVERIVDHTLGFVGRRYESIRLFRQVLGELGGHWPERGNRDALICSYLVGDAFQTILGEHNPLYEGSLPPLTRFVTPAHLFIQSGVVDIE